MLWLVVSESARKRHSEASLNYANQIAAHDRALGMGEIDAMDGHAFEQYVASLLVNEGYSDVEVTRGSGDFGVDIVAHRDDVRVAIQVKRHASNISRHAITDAVAGKKHYGCTEGDGHHQQPLLEISQRVCAIGRMRID